MKLILHIGAPKTGTSHLQRSFHENSDALIKHGILYPKVGRKFGKVTFDRSIGLRFAAEPIDQNPNGLMSRAGLSRSVDRAAYANSFQGALQDEIKNTGEIKTVVMSDEALFKFSSAKMILELSSIVNDLFTEIVVVSFVRPPSDYIASTYSQAVKMGAKKPWHEYLNDQIAKAAHEGIFAERLSMWKTHMECDEFVVRVLQSDILPQFKDVSDIHYIPEPAKTGRNSALSPIGIHVLRRINELVGTAQDRPKQIRRVFENYATGSKWKPNLEDLQRIDSAFEEEMKSLCELFKMPQMDQDIILNYFEKEYASFTPHGAEIYSDQTIDELANIVLGLCERRSNTLPR